MTTDADRAQDLELAEYERNQRHGIMTLPIAPSAKYCTELYCAECQERREKQQRLLR